MEEIQFSGTWKEIWTKKGEVEGTAEDILVYDGWEKSITSIEKIADKIQSTLQITDSERVLEVGCGAGGYCIF